MCSIYRESPNYFQCLTKQSYGQCTATEKQIKTVDALLKQMLNKHLLSFSRNKQLKF